MSKKTPLHDIHVELGASFVDCAGWSMALCYTSELAEHNAVRTSAGVFDLTHTGKIELSGPEAARALDHALVGDLAKIAVSRGHYSMLVHESGGVLADLVVYRLEKHRYLVVANPANTAIVVACLRDRIDGYMATMKDASSEWALIALQGPKSPAIIGELVDIDVSSLESHAIDRARLKDSAVLLSRSDYTGEEGFAIYCRPEDAAEVWRAIDTVGMDHGLVPCGLACQDTLRLEAGMPLHGRELTVRTTPFDAGLGRVVVFGKPGGFVGEAALAALLRNTRPARVLVGLTSAGLRVPRTGSAVFAPVTGEHIGEVTSGILSPTLGRPVAMAYLRADRRRPGTKVLIDHGDGQVHAEVVTLPFYRRQT